MDKNLQKNNLQIKEKLSAHKPRSEKQIKSTKYMAIGVGKFTFETDAVESREGRRERR